MPQLGAAPASGNRLDYNWIEHVSQTLYPNGNPILELEVRKKGLEAFNQQAGSYTIDGVSGNVNFIDNEEQYLNIGVPTYPETRPAKYERVSRVYEAIKSEVKETQPAGSLVCDIKVTHNFFVEKIALLIEPER